MEGATAAKMLLSLADEIGGEVPAGLAKRLMAGHSTGAQERSCTLAEPPIRVRIAGAEVPL